MLYVSSERDGLYGVTDTADGVEDKNLTAQSLLNLVSNGIGIIGVNALGIFVLTEAQANSFDSYMHILKELSAQNSKFKLERYLLESTYNNHIVYKLSKYIHGLVCLYSEYIIRLLDDGTITCNFSESDSASVANISGFNGEIPLTIVLYATNEFKETASKCPCKYKYYLTANKFISAVGREF